MKEKIGCGGFRAGAVAAGLKKAGKKDLGMIVSDVPASVAGVFTKNRIQAAPVVLTKERIGSGVCRALVANSGNANCCTGDRGMADAVSMARLPADGLGLSESEVLVASTGVIGQSLNLEKIAAAIPELISKVADDGFADFAEAIMTTDTVPKIETREGEIDGKPYRIVGVAKGAGMIRPDMATMLCFVCTDAAVKPDALQTLLSAANEKTFNRITIDGDTSTNDTVLVMANGMSGAAVTDPAHVAAFGALLQSLMLDLAKKIVKDGEGATKLVEIRVSGAENDGDARAVADTVANSSLVKTALFGEDANWGRIIAAAGRAGVAIDPDQIEILFDDVKMVENGLWCGPEAESAATQILKKPEFVIDIRLAQGKGESSVFTCDFSVDYVKINADYRS